MQFKKPGYFFCKSKYESWLTPGKGTIKAITQRNNGTWPLSCFCSKGYKYTSLYTLLDYFFAKNAQPIIFRNPENHGALFVHTRNIKKR